MIRSCWSSASLSASSSSSASLSASSSSSSSSASASASASASTSALSLSSSSLSSLTTTTPTTLFVCAPRRTFAGHSKWANIQHKKGKNDLRRQKLFSKVCQELSSAARHGGGDGPDNLQLAGVLDKARAINLPKANIKAAIDRGCGRGADDAVLHELLYEGYSAAGEPLLIEAASDNKNRTAQLVKSFFTKQGGNLSAMGSVAYMFERRGVLRIGNHSEDELLELCAFGDERLAACAVDVVDDVRTFVLGEPPVRGLAVLTTPPELYTVKRLLEAAGVDVVDADTVMLPASLAFAERSDEQLDELERYIERLDDDVPDVTAVWHACTSPLPPPGAV